MAGVVGPIRVVVDGAPAVVIDVLHRGFQYGHGMFETCRVVAGCVPLWTYHRARLTYTADECSLTNAVIGVWPLVRILGLDEIGQRLGRITLGIRTALEARFGFSTSY